MAYQRALVTVTGGTGGAAGQGPRAEAEAMARSVDGLMVSRRPSPSREINGGEGRHVSELAAASGALVPEPRQQPRNDIRDGGDGDGIAASGIPVHPAQSHRRRRHARHEDTNPSVSNAALRDSASGPATAPHSGIPIHPGPAQGCSGGNNGNVDVGASQAAAATAGGSSSSAAGNNAATADRLAPVIDQLCVLLQSLQSHLSNSQNQVR